MYTPAYTRQFSKDVKLARKRGMDLGKLKTIVRDLITDQRLDAIHRDHRPDCFA